MLEGVSLSVVMAAVGLVAGLLVFTFVVLPLLLAAVYSLYGYFSFSSAPFQNSKLFVGRVWHARFQPKRHAFTYPIFYFALDLEEVTRANKKFLMWPLVQFQEADHLKNGEGRRGKNDGDGDDGGFSLAQRILRLIAERTNNTCQPSLETHRVVLLTHLTYYGYNFNPVSFYYVIEKAANTITAMVGEVSNTPWLEMYPYVLHPNSTDKVTCSDKTKTKHHYNFPKAFHVSPFMEMDYFYDWIFTGVPSKDPSIKVINSLLRPPTNEEDKSTKQENDKDNDTELPSKPQSRMAFTAKLVADAKPITPMNVAWQIIKFPIFCMLIQIWIHYEAFWLFAKGVAYIPHPEGSETTASWIIGTMTIPLFALKDRISSYRSAKTTKTKKSLKSD